MSADKLFKMAEVAENNGKNGKRTWFVIKDIVYDVTDYLDDHPGGGDLLRDEAGRDATKAFNDFGHSGDAKNMLKKYKIGELVEEDRKQNKSKKEPKVKAVPDENNTRSLIGIISCGCFA